MVYLDNPYTDPGFNLAAEEYLLNAYSEDILMLWQNASSVIVGKHQDVPTEVNLDFTRRRNIPVYRRQSGGGTVYHDSGNINLTFIETGVQPDFGRYTERIRKALSELGTEAVADCRNGLYIDGLKVSGSAQFLRRGKVLFHATLLYATDLNALTQALDSPDFDRTLPNSKRVKSIKSPVTNIATHLNQPLSTTAFKQELLKALLHEFPNCKSFSFSDSDLNAIHVLQNEKYNAHAYI